MFGEISAALSSVKKVLLLYTLYHQFLQLCLKGDELYTKIDKNHPPSPSLPVLPPMLEYMRMHTNINQHTRTLYAVITAQEAATLWGLSRNALSSACKRGALNGRKSGKTWLMTIEDVLRYQRGRYPDNIPTELQAAFDTAIANLASNS